MRPKQRALLCDSPTNRNLGGGHEPHTRGTWINNLVYNVHFLSASSAHHLRPASRAPAAYRSWDGGLPARRTSGGERTTSRPCEELWNLRRANQPKPGHHAVALFMRSKGELSGVWVQVTNRRRHAEPHPTASKLNERRRSQMSIRRATDQATVVLPSAFCREERRLWQQRAPHAAGSNWSLRRRATMFGKSSPSPTS